MLPGVAYKAVVLYVTSALTSTAAMGTILNICTLDMESVLLYDVASTSNGSLAGCPVFHPTITCSAVVNVHSPHDEMNNHDTVYTQPVPWVIYDQLVFQSENDALDY